MINRRDNHHLRRKTKRGWAQLSAHTRLSVVICKGMELLWKLVWQFLPHLCEWTT